MSSGIASFFSSFITTTHSDAEEKAPADAEVVVEEPAAEEEEDPEDLHPIIREEFKASAKCASLTKHFEHCQEKVQSGQGFKGEDCVEELCLCVYLTLQDFVTLTPSLPFAYTFAFENPVHMMHCVDELAAPKLFGKLR